MVSSNSTTEEKIFVDSGLRNLLPEAKETKALKPFLNVTNSKSQIS